VPVCWFVPPESSVDLPSIAANLVAVMEGTMPKTNEKPQFTHDCDICTFLGTFNGADLYHHAESSPTIIARFSSDGPDYTSGVILADVNPFLGEAKRRALARYLKCS
jgi:hypothetical protein